jgi:hypothetical protein
MKLTLVRAPIVVGSLISGAFVLFAVLEILLASPRWDDHLINAVGVFAAGLFISFTLRLATAAFRPQPDAPKRAKLIQLVGLIAFVSLIVVAIKVAMFIDGMSFL